jgi:quercetin dioxygenase-like cupin family protein
MKRNRKRFLATIGITAIGAVVATSLIVVPALATPPSGTTFTLLAPVAQFGEIDAKAKFGDWESEIETKGASDLHITEVTIQAGGHGGWHSHPGPSFIIVKSGTATLYEGEGPCTARAFPTGSGLFEPAGDVHIVRNEGSQPLVLVVAQLVATGAPRRIDEPRPGNCPF